MPSFHQRIRSRSSSISSAEGSQDGQSRPRSRRSKHVDGQLPPPILVYHESARSIVFRDHLRRAASRSSSNLSQVAKKEETLDGEGTSPPVVATAATTAAATTTTTTNKQPASPVRRDPFIEVTSELTRSLGLDKGETVIPSQAEIPIDQIANFQPRIQPLPPLALGPDDEFRALLQQTPTQNQEQALQNTNDWTRDEVEVVRLLQTQQATVKTIRNGDWTAFLKRFQESQHQGGKWATDHSDVAPHDDWTFNSFVTSTSLLPDSGQKMRCFGSLSQFTVGVVFALPQAHQNPTTGQAETEEEAVTRTRTWSWPSGYSAKTEFNIDSRGNLINGRQEALTPPNVLRQYNYEYLHCEEYTVANRKVSGLSQIPYNEVFLRVGGCGRIVNGHDVATGQAKEDATGTGRSLDKGVGLPVALFVRSASFANLMLLLRTRSRLVHVWGEAHCKSIPLLMITPEEGVRVFTESLQVDFWKLAASSLNPFQNPALARKTTIDNTDVPSFQQKVDELLDLDKTIQEKLTPEELAHLAGGFGATDESVVDILQNVMLNDVRATRRHRHSLGKNGDNNDEEEESHQLQDFVNEGLTAAVRSGDYLTARQLLMLYSIVAAKKEELAEADDDSLSDYSHSEFKHSERSNEDRRESSLGNNVDQLAHDLHLVKKQEDRVSLELTPPPPPPPLDTDRLRGATNSDGLLAVLGAAQILKAMQDGGAKKRTQEVVNAVGEWVEHGEQSMAFRISSWYDQRAAQGDLQIATENDSNFMAFVSNKAIANRRNFADQLRQAVGATDFEDVRFLRAIEEMVNQMHAPCLRLELLQYVLGLDNRFSVSHVARAVHLASVCLSCTAAPGHSD